MECTPPLYLAVAYGHRALVSLLLDQKGDPSLTECFGDTALITAATDGRADIVKVLLAARGTDRIAADPNQLRATDGASALYLASQDGHIEAVDALIRGGADPNLATTDTGDSPLQMAMQQQHTQVVRALLDAHADPSHNSKVGGTALHIAAQFGDIRSIQALLAANANINATRTDKSGGSVLMSAAQHGHAEVVEQLLSAEADPTLTVTNTTITALDLAKRKGHTAVVKLLEHLPGYQGYERL